MESAVKQSLQAFIPKVNELRFFKELMQQANADQKFIAHCYETPKQEIKQLDFKDKSTLIMIGPEGDFTLEEVELSKQNNF